VHPPHQQVGVELAGPGFAELPASAPLADAEHDRTEVPAGLGEHVGVVDVLDDAGRLQLAETSGQQRP
jgi:hypothetical protein